MINVKDVLKVNKNISALVCDLFPDEDVTKTIEADIGKITSFKVENVTNCFSQATTRIITVFGDGDYARIKKIKFV